MYIGVTDNLERRILEHKYKFTEGFTKTNNVAYLVYFEELTDIIVAIKREKQLKNWHRDWKLNLIKEKNPLLKDLWQDFSYLPSSYSNPNCSDPETSSG